MCLPGRLSELSPGTPDADWLRSQLEMLAIEYEDFSPESARRRDHFLKTPPCGRAPGAPPARFSGGGSCANPVRTAGGHRSWVFSKIFPPFTDSPAGLGAGGELKLNKISREAAKKRRDFCFGVGFRLAANGKRPTTHKIGGR